eukprot:TRINITY_DN44185_c0_g1_i1.p1 TRINITY_DN44185_c0_g1~~TRINITY_DN44185_c0_g1_i1.p1  ORF type:complete len:489 (-),score=63.42 TRINITY_DN44185_c0_g1_i1:106-1551(-)
MIYICLFWLSDNYHRFSRIAFSASTSCNEMDKSCHLDRIACHHHLSQGFIDQSSPSFFHGRLWPLIALTSADTGGATPEAPSAAWTSSSVPRPDHTAAEDQKARPWLTATEWVDEASVFKRKVALLASLLVASRHTVLYTGAGISTAAGIGQAAVGMGARRAVRGFEAEPTQTHHALGALAARGLVHGWIQQNHDGLPQKAGFPQHRINEIHGGWYDPSNPVVLYSGSLRNDLCDDMVHQSRHADLVLVLGTSLSGLNADRVPVHTAERSRVPLSADATAALSAAPSAADPSERPALSSAGPLPPLGFVVVNLQQTPHDGKASLRINGRTDDVFAAVLAAMSLPPVPPNPPPSSRMYAHVPSRALVPYNAEGRPSSGRKMWLDLQAGARIRLSPGHNIAGAKQPAYMCIVKRDKTGRVPAGVGHVARRDDTTCSFILAVEGASMRLGTWWMAQAVTGTATTLPVVNVAPQFEADGAAHKHE